MNKWGKTVVKFLLKLTLAALIIGWLINSGKLDFSLLKTSLTHPSSWIIPLFILFINLFLTSIRWKKILEMKTEEKYSALSVFRLTWIGQLFSVILPGAVSGDFIKIYYAHDMDKKLNKTFLLTSVLMDRVIGLIGLLFLLLVGVVKHMGAKTTYSLEIQSLIHFNLILLSFAIIFVVILFIPSKFQEKIIGLIKLVPFIGKKIAELFFEMWHIGKNRMQIINLILLSMGIQSMSIFAFFMLTSPYFQYTTQSQNFPVGLLESFSFIPIGLISTAIPITPSGIGVGHAIFDKIFSLYGVNNGASLFNLFFLGTLLINLSGAIPYLFHRQKKIVPVLNPPHNTAV